MASPTIHNNLQAALEERCKKVPKSSSAILFRRGEKAFGMFLVLKGKVRLDLGVDSAHATCYGPGALVGLPATLTRSTYTMTATVAEDSELGFLQPEELEMLLRDNPDFCREMLTILGERVQEIQRMKRTMLEGNAASSFAFEPMSLIVPMTITRIAASITAYSAMS